MGDINVDDFFLLFSLAYLLHMQCWSVCGDMHVCWLVLTDQSVVTNHKVYGNAGLPSDFCLHVARVYHDSGQDAVGS